MLQPTRTKFRKAHKGRIKGVATSGVELAFGHFGLKALEPERVTARQIDNTLYDAFGQRHVARLYTALNQYYVILEVEPSYQFGPEALRRIYVRSQSGTMVPIGEIATAVPDVTPLAINHQNQFPSMTLSFNLAPGVTIGTAVTAATASSKS